MNDDSIAVIIAAFNAEQTIGNAISSALACPQVSEVVVVDDASRDGTVRAANCFDERVKVLEQPENRGPACARNWAIRESRAPLIAILDADDHFLPNRFERMLSGSEWDLLADNLIVYEDAETIAPFMRRLSLVEGWYIDLRFEDFVRGNIPRRGMRRGEMGFLKPIIRRSFLVRHGLAYRENCRLGEDFLLYAEALALGARFKVMGAPGYASLVRSNSLSSQHDTGDLRALVESIGLLISTLQLTQSQRATLRLFEQNTRRRLAYRDVLEMRRKKGVLSGFLAAIREPSSIFDRGLDMFSNTDSQPTDLPRLLFDPDDFCLAPGMLQGFDAE